jgi:hypothetical protein
VKVDGIMGNLWRHLRHSLGFTDKDVDGIRGIKTTAAINARIKKCLLRLWHKASYY